MGENKNEILKRLLNSPHPLPPQLTGLIASKCQIKQFEKKQKIVESGEINHSEYFLLDGIIHRFTLVENGEFITTGFYVAPAILMPHFARTYKGKSIFSLQALTDVTIAEVPASVLDHLKDSHTEIRRWGQKVIERKLKRNFLEEIRFRSANAKERLIHLREEYPNLENMVPHTCIASYVGITPVSFSRLRKELTGSA